LSSFIGSRASWEGPVLPPALAKRGAIIAQARPGLRALVLVWPPPNDSRLRVFQSRRLDDGYDTAPGISDLCG